MLEIERWSKWLILSWKLALTFETLYKSLTDRSLRLLLLIFHAKCSFLKVNRLFLWKELKSLCPFKSNLYCPLDDQKALEKQVFDWKVSTILIITNHDKVITNYDRVLLQITIIFLLQMATVVTNYDKPITNYDRTHLPIACYSTI